ncbi:MAG: hypothetical protein HND47_14910 [Chloroflexi bacterium]|nr:hypothetical protein [Chloroflexota bacterium]
MQVHRGDVQRAGHFASLVRKQGVGCGARRRAVADAFRDQADDLAHDQHGDGFRAAPAGLPVCQHDGKPAGGAFDHFERIPALGHGVFVDLCDGDLDFHILDFTLNSP